MLQNMFSGSWAVLRHPTVATFEENERNHFGLAIGYIALASMINGALGALAYVVQRPYAEQQIRSLQDTNQNVPSQLWDVMRGQSFGSAIISSVLATCIGFLIYLGLVYMLGRWFGGTGAFGELAYDTALFTAPLSVLIALVRVAAIGPVAIVSGFVVLVCSVYQLYLTFTSIQSGMNLTRDKAVSVMLMLLVVGVVVFCLLGAAFTAFVMYVGLV